MLVKRLRSVVKLRHYVSSDQKKFLTQLILKELLQSEEGERITRTRSLLRLSQYIKVMYPTFVPSECEKFQPQWPEYYTDTEAEPHSEPFHLELGAEPVIDVDTSNEDLSDQIIVSDDEQMRLNSERFERNESPQGDWIPLERLDNSMEVDFPTEADPTGNFEGLFQSILCDACREKICGFRYFPPQTSTAASQTVVSRPKDVLEPEPSTSKQTPVRY